jgi:Outer membrane protein beta-barrel domain
MLFRSNAVTRFLEKAGLGVALGVALAAFSIVPLHAQSQTQTSSSSADYRFLLDSDELGGLEPPPAPSAQYGSQNGANPPTYRSRWDRLAVEAGGGFTAPLGNSSRDLTWGWNFRGGLGYNFTKKFAVLGEYEFDRSKIPAAILEQVGTPGGNVHTWSLTLDPEWKYKTGGNWGGYIIGGGGFYRQLTSFTEPVLAQGVYCNYFYCYPIYYQATAVVSHYSSNQGGLNIGTGLTFGNWNQAKFFAEARYEWLDTPGHSTQIIPVTFGIRW